MTIIGTSDDYKVRGKLTAKERTFARLVAEGRTQVDAYIIAYDVDPDVSRKTHTEKASKLMALDKIRSRVEQLIALKEQALARASLNDREKALSKIRELMEHAGPEDAVKLRATELLGRSVGLFKDVVINEDAPADAEDLMDEIRRELDQLPMTADDMSDGDEGDGMIGPDSLH